MRTLFLLSLILAATARPVTARALPDADAWSVGYGRPAATTHLVNPSSFTTFSTPGFLLRRGLGAGWDLRLSWSPSSRSTRTTTVSDATGESDEREVRGEGTWSKLALARRVANGRSWNASLYLEGGYGWYREDRGWEPDVDFVIPRNRVETWCAVLGLRVEIAIGGRFGLVSRMGVERTRSLVLEETAVNLAGATFREETRSERVRWRQFGGLGSEWGLRLTLVYRLGG